MISGKHSCDECIWFDECGCDEPCEDIVLVNEDAEVDDIIEGNRELFFSEWSRYTKYAR